MKSINKVQLMGNLGKDPELRKINNEIPVCSFPMATNEKYKDKEGQIQDQTEWHNIVAWRELGELIQKLCNKGDTILIEGHLRSRTWESKQGEKRHTTEIIADSFILIKKANQNT